MKDFDTFTKIAKNVGYLSNIIRASNFESCLKVNKSPNLATLKVAQMSGDFWSSFERHHFSSRN